MVRTTSSAHVHAGISSACRGDDILSVASDNITVLLYGYNTFVRGTLESRALSSDKRVGVDLAQEACEFGM